MRIELEENLNNNLGKFFKETKKKRNYKNT